jgi:hypothetical protein
VAAIKQLHAQFLHYKRWITFGAKLIVVECSFTGEKSEGVGLEDAPQARVLAQIDQLHFPVPAARSITALQ